LIVYYDRKTKTYQTEKVAGERIIRWTYNSPVGMTLLETVVKKRICSSFYGWYHDRRISRRKIYPFVSKFDLDLSLPKKSSMNFPLLTIFFIAN